MNYYVLGGINPQLLQFTCRRVIGGDNEPPKLHLAICLCEFVCVCVCL